MSEKIMRALQRWAPLFVVLALALGILLGLGLGWQVWPVRWYNTDPSDLRLEQQMAYVVTTADSMAITADPVLAKQRLEQLVDEDTSWEQVANLVERVAQAQDSEGDAASALRVRQMARLTGLPAATQQDYQAPERSVTASVSGLGLILLGVGVILAVLGIAGYVLLNRNRQAVPAPIESESRAWTLAANRDPDDNEATFVEPVLARGTRVKTPALVVPAATGLTAAPPPRVGASDADETPPDEEPESIVIEERKSTTTRGAQPFQDEPVLRSPFGLGRKRGVAKVAAETVASQASQSGVLGTFEAEYSFGQDDFDCSFSIESPEGDFFGECGIGITDVLSTDGTQKVDAFELWLFDKGDIRTVSKILVSEYAHQDETLAAQLSAKGELVPAEPGLVVELETLSLRVTATIKTCQLADDGPRPNAYFAQLAVDLIVDKGDAA